MKIREQELMTPGIFRADIAALEQSNIITKTRVQSIDLLRGVVMIIMALDHVRDYFHNDAFLYSPTDLSKTSIPLFLTRFITHYCAPVFVFLAGSSAYLSGTKKSKHELSSFLFTRGIWLVIAELFILSLFRTFNPTFEYLNLQVIWAIGLSMIVLSGMIYMKTRYVLVLGIALVFGHNLLDNVHVNGNGLISFLWAVLHEQKSFQVGYISVSVKYPVLPWIGIMALGYCCGSLYSKGFDEKRRRKLLLLTGVAATALFIALRVGNLYGEAYHWSSQKNTFYSFLSFINVTKYPPSLLYILITLGPSLIFLAVSEKPTRSLGKKIIVFGNTPMFYYMAHLLLIHILASIAALMTGYPEMIILHTSVDQTAALKGYGFNLVDVYLIWGAIIFFLYPFCKWFGQYKRENQSKHWWLRYL
jgi:uncharacterized membrane protein